MGTFDLIAAREASSLPQLSMATIRAKTLRRALILIAVCSATLSGVASRRGRGRGRGKVPQDAKGDRVQTEANAGQRDGRIFSLFNVVTFPNTACQSSSSTTTGSNRN